MIMAVSGGTGVSPEDVKPAFDSLVLDEPPTKLPSIENPYESEHFSITVPEGWDATTRPPGGTRNKFDGTHCETGTNVLVTDEPLDGRTVAGFARESLKEYRQPGEFPEFKLYGQRSIKVQGAAKHSNSSFLGRARTASSGNDRSVPPTRTP